MKPEDHLDTYRELRDAIFEWGVEMRGLKNSQRTIGLNAPRALVELLSAYLHEEDLIGPGKQINHRWFKSENVGSRLPEFPKKSEILDEMRELEILCEKLAYGSSKPKEKMKEALKIFREVESEIKSLRDEK